jgi:hypothetical protein
MQTAFLVPHDDRRWYVMAMAITTFVVGAWQVDKARTK